jgi:S-adenosylmethionine decarboxylase
MEYKKIDPSIYNYQVWVDEINTDTLYNKLNTILETSGYTILNHIEHHFPVQGYTCLWLLAESHLAVHTFPESSRSYIELSGCNKEMNKRFVELFAKEFVIVERQEKEESIR